ncbi:MAG: hypothetical protein MMC23_001495 [Stictis urceolatum]|nr:hypothetical protein [Stictis urceolata]
MPTQTPDLTNLAQLIDPEETNTSAQISSLTKAQKTFNTALVQHLRKQQGTISQQQAALTTLLTRLDRDDEALSAQQDASAVEVFQASLLGKVDQARLARDAAAAREIASTSALADSVLAKFEQARMAKDALAAQQLASQQSVEASLLKKVEEARLARLAMEAKKVAEYEAMANDVVGRVKALGMKTRREGEEERRKEKERRAGMDELVDALPKGKRGPGGWTRRRQPTSSFVQTWPL